MENRLKQLYDKLGFTEDNGLFFLDKSDLWLHIFPYRISRVLKDIIQPNAFFCLHYNSNEKQEHPVPFNQSFILFFDNPSQDREELLHKQIINFGLAYAVFINRTNTIDLFHGN